MQACAAGNTDIAGVLLDARPGKAAAKRWDWVRKGAPFRIDGT